MVSASGRVSAVSTCAAILVGSDNSRDLAAAIMACQPFRTASLVTNSPRITAACSSAESACAFTSRVLCEP